MMPFVFLDRRRLKSWLLTTAMIVSVACSPEGVGPVDPPASGDAPSRIVSLAPSVTEVLLSLDLGDRVVGVTRFCRWSEGGDPPLEVGGYLDINTEAIVSLEPDLVVLIQDHRQARARLVQLGLQTLQVDQGSVSGILQSIESIAIASGVPERGRTIVRDLEDRLSRVEAKVRDVDRPTTLIVVGRQAGHGSLRTVWVAGPDTFYDDVLDLAGGVNVVPSSSVLYPELSVEGLLHLDPDVILDLLADLGDRQISLPDARADWAGLTGLQAQRSGRLYLVDQPWAVVPGPSVVDLVEHVARLLHPELG